MSETKKHLYYVIYEYKIKEKRNIGLAFACLHLKMNTPEITEGKRFDRVNDYIEKNMAQIEEVIKKLPDKHEQSWEELNKIFIDLL